jgi:hypothetical protein
VSERNSLASASPQPALVETPDSDVSLGRQYFDARANQDF